MKYAKRMGASVALGLAALAMGCTSVDSGKLGRSGEARLRQALTFHASFDRSTDADFSNGDARLQVGPQWGAPRVTSPGLPPGNTVHLAPGEGRFGGALRFEKKIKELVAYRATDNIAYNRTNWSGTVSYWLRLNPEVDLEPGYCDPIQITSKDWNDAAFFTDFSKDEKPRHFRYGAFADLSVWNPNKIDWEKVPEKDRPMVTVTHPPFSRERWTHVVFTWENFNTSTGSGVGRFYLNGELKGQVGPKVQTYSWEPGKAFIMLGLSYTGWMDDLAIFNRALTDAEVGGIYRSEKGIGGMRK